MLFIADVQRSETRPRERIEVVYVHANVESSGVITMVSTVSPSTKRAIGPGHSGIELFSPARFSLQGHRFQWTLGFSHKSRDVQEEPINLFDLERSELLMYSLGFEWTRAIGNPYFVFEEDRRIIAEKKSVVPFVGFGIRYNAYKIFSSTNSPGYSAQGISYSAMVGFENSNRARFGFRYSVHPNSGPLSLSSFAFEIGGVL